MSLKQSLPKVVSNFLFTCCRFLTPFILNINPLVHIFRCSPPMGVVDMYLVYMSPAFNQLIIDFCFWIVYEVESTFFRSTNSCFLIFIEESSKSSPSSLLSRSPIWEIMTFLFLHVHVPEHFFIPELQILFQIFNFSFKINKSFPLIHSLYVNF